MNDFDLALKTPLPPEGAAGLVPVSYAEKAMASLMQLHSEVLEEKERRVELHRRLMEKEQALAELKMYVKLLEEKLEKPAPAAVPRAVARPPPEEASSLRPSAPQAVPAPAVPIARAAPKPPLVPRQAPAAHHFSSAPAPAAMAVAHAARSRPAPDGWKTW